MTTTAIAPVRRAALGTETRTVPFDAESGDGRNLVGYAAIFDSTTRIRDTQGEFDEVIRSGAFKRSIEHRLPVLQFDHGRDPRIGGTPIGKIERLSEDSKGLHVRARLFAHPDVERVREAIVEGAVTGMSFRFQVPPEGDTWTRDYGRTELREVREADVFELGPVVFPAYGGTSVAVRSRSAGPARTGEIVGYLLRWHVEIRTTVFGSGEVMARVLRGSLDSCLAQRGLRVPILVNHGRAPFSADRSAVLGEPIGWWDELVADEYGLLGRGRLDLSKPLAVAAAERIRSGEWKALSFRADVVDDRKVGTRDGLNRVDLTQLRLVEAGPTPNPADPGAVILAFDGRSMHGQEPLSDLGRADVSFDELLAEAERVIPGLNIAAAANDAGMRRLGREQRVQDIVERAERIVFVLRAKRNAAISEARWAGGALAGPGAFRAFLDARREAEAVEQDLLATINGDRDLLALLERAHDVPALPSIVGAAKAAWRR